MAAGPGLLWRAREYVDRSARQSPARLALGVFALVIAGITALLQMPFATADGEPAPLVDALFTATSATTVTGLVVVPTGEYWSGWGLAVILVAIKIGGLGVMTLASLLGMAVSRRIGLTQRLLVSSETKVTRLGEVGSLVRTVIITSTVLEVAIALVLFPRLLVHGEPPGTAAWHALFYAVSAFNNAGFVPTPEGLAPFVSDWWMLLPIIVGVFIGSLGFPVILNVAHHLRAPGRWSLHSKLTITTSVGLVVFGSVVVAAFEWTNPGTFQPLDGGGTILASLFAGVMPRSGGFSTVDVGQMHEGTWLLLDALMFVGGGSASTAGGIKVTTLAVMLLAIVAEGRGDRDVEAFGRRIPRETLQVAIAVGFISATIVLIASLLLLAMTGLTLDRVLFEVISAFATCGLSTGITADLPTPAKYVLVVLMFIGRTGTMTLAAALALRNRRRVIRYPEERPIIG
ncbi:TrkH family potassium uptake protein [Cellulomonas sp. zg-ZUI222]|uniref:TrkH family potassium uptake protein n=1 Tax=Cellulomonas wangleii TaxID=2816956 RepID=A0ABX8D256_9CELL|nr:MULTISPECIES: potassium transporter TrkG [Cellulomonas]MBO0899540.1 TrkH family potassium uptake protein [Cellulomonas sp. zg-ZUI22]MBO0920403.1 TrkH family potassium uptake protein [Cellulomonas wangleii]MBO0923179.1 TrkH family potassium uptake protein [Cellulomonas wangleii]QVI61553.1 TrkH family potassium uptake protein [Cellulomonas wangleii]